MGPMTSGGTARSVPSPSSWSCRRARLPAREKGVGRRPAPLGQLPLPRRGEAEVGDGDAWRLHRDGPRSDLRTVQLRLVMPHEGGRDDVLKDLQGRQRLILQYGKQVSQTGGEVRDDPHPERRPSGGSAVATVEDIDGEVRQHPAVDNRRALLRAWPGQDARLEVEGDR